MVQLVYYELRGRSCRKLLRRAGTPHKILMFPEESWARNTMSTYWLLSVSWWSKFRCNITQVAGSQRKLAKGTIKELGNGCLCVYGTFKNELDPNFKLTLTSQVTTEDFNMGYSLTGILERGSGDKNELQPSHFAAVRRKECNAAREPARYHQHYFKNSHCLYPIN